MTLSSTDTIEHGGKKSIFFFPFLPLLTLLVSLFIWLLTPKNVEEDLAEWSVYSDFDKAMDFTETHLGNEVIKNLCLEGNIFWTASWLSFK